MTLTFIQGQSCMKNQNFARKIFSWFGWNSVSCQTWKFVEAHSKFILVSNIQGRELCWPDFIRYTINIVLCWDTCEPICFELSAMLDTTKIYSLIPVWMTLMSTQGHRVTGKLELIWWLCCKVARSNSNVRDGWVCKQDDCEEILYGEYGSFEHLLILFCFGFFLEEMGSKGRGGGEG